MWAEDLRDENPLVDLRRACVEGAERIVDVWILSDLRNAAAVVRVRQCFECAIGFGYRPCSLRAAIS